MAAPDVAIQIQGSRLTYTQPTGLVFQGAVQPDGSFRLIPVASHLVAKRMLAPPLLEGRVSGDRVSGDVMTRWCDYRFVAKRSE